MRREEKQGKDRLLPVAVGFGISTPEQAREITLLADGIVVGSTFARLIKENSDKKNLLKLVISFSPSIKTALHNVRED
ncbi:MAG: tryptophan synthase subunit alpha [Syntrophales bacterium]